MNEYFFDTGVSVSTDFIDSIKEYIAQSKESDWKIVLQMTLLLLPVELFKTSPELMKIITKFGAENRLAVYKTAPNTSYHWHKDISRFTCLNVLLDGYDSLCLFAQPPDQGMMYDMQKLDYQPNRVYLLNVTQLHSVINFSTERHLLSIGVPPPTRFDDVQSFIETEILDKKTK